MTIDYFTRDGQGNDYIKKVQIKEYKTHEADNYICPICHRIKDKGIDIKDIVSGSFTDWAFLGDSKFICPECSRYFSLNFYNYVINPDGIHIYNVRKLKDELIRPQKTPFMFCISTTQKKHLFYKAKWNYIASPFSVNLETETICTSNERMTELFSYVEALQTLGSRKDDLKAGKISFDVYQKLGKEVRHNAIEKLNRELRESREIQIPLYCGQKYESEEKAICTINSIVKIKSTEEQL